MNRPTNWARGEMAVNAAELPPDTEINSNGAGDAFTSGLLIAAMLRNTGVCMQYGSPVKLEPNDVESDTISSTGVSEVSQCTPSKKVTPYSLYMRENYVALKAQCSDDKKAIFEKCNEMWEEESDEVKLLYERMADEEKCKSQDEAAGDDVLNAPDSPSVATLQSPKMRRNLNLINQPMNLETAAQFACLVAARHVDTATRDCSHLNINTIREQSSVSAHGLEEI
jgi:hypothetical protein